MSNVSVIIQVDEDEVCYLGGLAKEGEDLQVICVGN